MAQTHRQGRLLPVQSSRRASELPWLAGIFTLSAPKNPQVYLSQVDHLQVRGECVEYIRQHQAKFKGVWSQSINNFLHLSCITVFGRTCRLLLVQAVSSNSE